MVSELEQIDIDSMSGKEATKALERLEKEAIELLGELDDIRSQAAQIRSRQSSEWESENLWPDAEVQFWLEIRDKKDGEWSTRERFGVTQPTIPEQLVFVGKSLVIHWRGECACQEGGEEGQEEA